LISIRLQAFSYETGVEGGGRGVYGAGVGFQELRGIEKGLVHCAVFYSRKQKHQRSWEPLWKNRE